MSDAAENLVVACPKCGKRYDVARTLEGKRVRCSCGAEFTLGAARPASAAGSGLPVATPVAAVAAPAPVRPTDCVLHPGVPAAFACSWCRALICQTCDFRQPDGSHLCPTCASRAVSPLAQPVAPWGAVGAPVAPTPPLAGARCQRHAEVAAVVRCTNCLAPICVTCRFQFPGGLHYCPNCATNPSRPLSSTRKGFIAWSMVMAGWVTLFLVILLSGALGGAAMHPFAGFMIEKLIMIPGLVGVGLACGGVEKRAGNPPIVWVTVIWNGILMAVWLFVSIVGLMAGEA